MIHSLKAAVARLAKQLGAIPRSPALVFVDLDSAGQPLTFWLVEGNKPPVAVPAAECHRLPEDVIVAGRVRAPLSYEQLHGGTLFVHHHPPAR